jgi:hypothetical protein
MAMVSLERIKFHTKVPTKGRGGWLLYFLTLLPLRRRLVSESQDPTLRRESDDVHTRTSIRGRVMTFAHIILRERCTTFGTL